MSTPTEKSVTVGLYWALTASSAVLIPRYTPNNWWECDMWRLTKAGMVDEYEIKLTVADFRNDVKKTERGRMLFDKETRQWGKTADRNKHEILATNEGGPNRFWYVIPRDMLDKVEIPSYAGVLTFSGGCNPFQHAKAPLRHSKKWEGNREKLYSAFYYRYWAHETKAKSTEGEMEPIYEPLPEPEDPIL